MTATPGDAADLVVLGGTVVLPEGPRRAGIAIREGKIVEIGPEGSLPAARRRLDVSGAVVLPGAVDVHMHYDRDGRLTDKVMDATRSAAYGGITSVGAFLLAEPGHPYGDTLSDAIAEVECDSYIDVAFHMYLRANDLGSLEEIPRLVERGVTSFKMAMAYKRRGMMCSDEFLLAAMDVIGRSGGVAMLHAESGETIDHLEQRAARAGRRAPTDYAATRPDYAEAEAVARAATFGRATDCPVYIVHLTSAAALDQVRSARARGHDVQAETCPQYLALTKDAMERFGPLAKVAPPLRTAMDQDALWRALSDGELSVVASDHAPYPSEKKLAAREDIFASPFGAPTVETLLPVLHSEGVIKRGLGLGWLARVTSEIPARLFGLYPRKGVLRTGADADLVVLDPSISRVVDHTALHSNADYTPFAGLTLTGWPATTIVSGEILIRDGQLSSEPGRARFLPRQPLVGRLSDRVPAIARPGARETSAASART